MPEEHPTCLHKGCDRPVYSDPHYPATDKCIFHAEKKDPQAFRDALAKQIKEWRREKADRWDFRGWVFTDRKQGSKWSHGNLFCRAVFPVQTSFHIATFSGDANFGNAVFSRNTTFRGVTFSGFAEFSTATFTTDVDFNGATFSMVANFKHMVFHGNAHFVHATFVESAFFLDSAFLKNVTFLGSIFSKHADFEGAYFQNYAGFSRVTFKSVLKLPYVSFARFGSFDECRIAGHVRLIWPGQGRKQITLPHKEGEREKRIPAETCVIERGKLRMRNLRFDKDEGILDLRRNALADDVLLRIEECKMDCILLEGTDCTRIEFYDNTWPILFGRQVVGDEYMVRSPKVNPLLRKHLSAKPPRWNLIEVTYQQLSRRFREDFNHPPANDFDRGIFDMRRLHAGQRVRHFGWIKKHLGLIAWYRYLSNYSGSVIRPVVWLVALIASFAWFYWMNTYTIVKGSANCDYLDYTKIAIQIAYLNRAGLEFARHNSLAVNILIALQVIATGTLVTLFLFAMRRRFKHG